MTNEQDYQDFISLPIEKRVEKAQNYTKHKNRVPVVILNKNKDFQLKGIKFLVSKNNTVARLSKTIRKNNDLAKDLSFQLWIGNKLLSPQQKIETIFEEQKSDDGFLYIQIMLVAAFGN